MTRAEWIAKVQEDRLARTRERIAKANEYAAQGLSPIEVARAMGISHSALKNLMSRSGRKYVVTSGLFLPADEGNTRRRRDKEEEGQPCP